MHTPNPACFSPSTTTPFWLVRFLIVAASRKTAGFATVFPVSCKMQCAESFRIEDLASRRPTGRLKRGRFVRPANHLEQAAMTNSPLLLEYLYSIAFTASPKASNLAQCYLHQLGHIVIRVDLRLSCEIHFKAAGKGVGSACSNACNHSATSS